MFLQDTQRRAALCFCSENSLRTSCLTVKHQSVTISRPFTQSASCFVSLHWLKKKRSLRPLCFSSEKATAQSLDIRPDPAPCSGGRSQGNGGLRLVMSSRGDHSLCRCFRAEAADCGSQPDDDVEDASPWRPGGWYMSTSEKVYKHLSVSSLLGTVYSPQSQVSSDKTQRKYWRCWIYSLFQKSRNLVCLEFTFTSSVSHLKI